MRNTEAIPQAIRRIGAHRPNALITFGYVRKDGTYVLVRGIAEELIGTAGAVKGVRVDYRGDDLALRALATPDPASTERRSVAFALAGIEAGEKIRAERAAEAPRTTVQGTPIARDETPATGRQVAYAMDLWATHNAGGFTRAEHDAKLAEFAAMTKPEISWHIRSLRDDDM